MAGLSEILSNTRSISICARRLPAGVTAEAVTFTHGASELPFTIAATDQARLGRAGGLVCRITIQPDTEPIIQMLGTGQVRVDEPRVTKPGG